MFFFLKKYRDANKTKFMYMLMVALLITKIWKLKKIEHKYILVHLNNEMLSYH